MEQGTCIICGNKAQRFICSECLKSFDFSEYGEEIHTATYSAEDDKLRLYSDRVKQELFAALIGYGFQWAPHQHLFYAVWMPQREDVALILCGEIVDEMSTMEDRANERASRFAVYGQNAHERSRRLGAEADKIAQRFWGGQPILIGHHSEKRARRDHERLNDKTRASLNEFDRGVYWKQRAENSSIHANRMLSEGPVINRIKKLEAELRRERNELVHARAAVTAWNIENITKEQVLEISDTYSVSRIFKPTKYPKSNYDGYKSVRSAMIEEIITPAEAQEICMLVYLDAIERHTRWIEHYESLVAYWKLFLVEKHGTDIDDQYQYKKGDWVVCNNWGRQFWGQVERVNRSRENKRITTLTVPQNTWRGPGDHYSNKWAYEDIKAVFDHEPTLAEVEEVLSSGG